MAEASHLAASLRSLVGAIRPPPERPLWIYGAGGFGRLLAERLAAAGRPVRGFVDRRAGTTPEVDGLPCLLPAAVGTAAARGAALVYGVMNYATAPDAILAWAGGAGFADLLFPADLRAIPGFALDHYWLADPSETLDHMPAIDALLGRLDDEESRRLVRDLLAYRLTTDPRRHPAVEPDSLYAPDFLPVFDRPIRFVDGGAYTGDSLGSLLGAGIRVAEWLAFEPDPGNFQRLEETAASARGSVGRIETVRAGLSDRTGTLRFSAGGGSSSRAATDSDHESAILAVPCVRLDDRLADPDGLYVKLDIEGAEMDALRGMAGLLAGRIVLAVSLYHRPADLWEIPKLVAELYDRPRMRIRQHHHHGFETVLYVWPA